MRYISLVIIVLLYFLTNAASAKSLTFKQALHIAYQNNPELRVEIDKAQAMRGAFIQSGLYPNPQLAFTAENFGGSGSYSSYESAETTASVTQPIPLGRPLMLIIYRLLHKSKCKKISFISRLVWLMSMRFILVSGIKSRKN